MIQHTKDKLADALRSIGLDKMAERAATGYYHDYLSPLDFPQLTLIDDLAVAAGVNPPNSGHIMALRKRVMSGDFDATSTEGEQWAASPEGQAAMTHLFRAVQR